MHDWNLLVREHLKSLGVTAQQQEEAISELAAHLEDLYDELRVAGMSDEQAFLHSLEQLKALPPKALARAKREEKIMNYRTKALWLPGLATLTAASVFLMALQQIPRLHPGVWSRNEGALVVDLPWLLLLPLCGAAGAYLSRRAGGRRYTNLVAGLFPAIVMLAVFFVFLPISVAVERNTFVIQHPVYFLLAAVNWTIIPGFALFLGVAAVWRKSTYEEEVSEGSNC